MTPTRSRLRPALAAAAACLLLAGCSLAPAYHRPVAPIPTEWSDGEHAPPAAGQTESAALDWQAFVLDPQLRRLVGFALGNNRDLRQALLDVEAARAAYRIERADRLPALALQGAGTRQRVPADLAGGTPAVQENWQVGVGLAAFELDLFGRVRNLSRAALQEYLATEEAARAVQVSLIGEVIEAYLARSGAWQRLQLTTATLEAREAALALVARRREAGTASALDEQEARGLAGQARADLERAERELRLAGNALALLVGVSDLRPLLAEAPATGTPLVSTLAAGAPSALIARRPDIYAAEHRLRARHADIGAARAAFFPRLSLTGLFGSASAEFSDLFASGQRAWSFSPQLALPIFAGGRNRANLDLAHVRRDIAVAGYEKTIQIAFREVSDALAATATLQREEAARRALVEAGAQALRLSEARWRAGVDDHLRYLDAQRSDFANRIALIDVSTQRQIALAGLFRALGGGWTAVAPAAAGEAG